MTAEQIHQESETGEDHMQLTEEDLIEMMSLIWETMLGEELLPIEIDDDHAFGMFSSVDIDRPEGESLAAVIECGAALASRLAEVLFSIPADAVTAEDAADAVGELANIFGGNVKGVLGLSAQLSLPHVVLGQVESASNLGTSVSRVAFQAGSNRLVVSLRDRQLVA